MRRQILWASVVMAVLGLVGPSWGPALIPARARFGVGLAEAGGLFAAFGICRALGSALAAAVSDRWSARVLMALYGVLLAGGLALQAAAPNWAVLVTGGALVGFAFGCLGTEVNAVAARTGPELRGRALSLTNAVYSLGATAGPFAVGLLLRAHLGWRLAFWAWAAAALLAGFGLAAACGGIRVPPSRSIGSGLDRRVAALAGMAFAYNGGGWAVSGWAATWLVVRFAAPLLTGALGATVFYGCLTLGRLVNGAVVHRVAVPRLLWWQAVASAAALVALSLAPNPGLALAAFGTAGFTLGGIYPNLVAHAAALVPDRPGAMAGAIATGGAVGVGLVPFSAGLLGDRGLPALGGLLVVLGIGLVVLAAWVRRFPPEAGPTGP